MFIYVFSCFSVKILLCSCQLTNLHAKTDDRKILDKNRAEHFAARNKESDSPNFIGFKNLLLRIVKPLSHIEIESISLVGNE
jgi:hypothetical protein